MWKLEVWESSVLSPVICAEDIFDQYTVCLAKLRLAHPHVFFSSHLCWNLSASLPFPSLISISTFKFRTLELLSPHILFCSYLYPSQSGSLVSQWFVCPSPQYSGTLTFLCAHLWMSTSGHALWHTVEVRGHAHLSGLTFNLRWSRDSLPHPDHCVCQGHWPADYWGFNCIHCQSPRRNAGIADALAACLAFTRALGILILPPTKPSPQSCPWHFHVSFEIQHGGSVSRCLLASNTQICFLNFLMLLIQTQVIKTCQKQFSNSFLFLCIHFNQLSLW